MEYSFRLYDVVRVDHFRGFDEYYSIPAGSETAIHGTWEKGPGIEVFQKMQEKFGKLDIIAEDLGFLTPSVLKLVKRYGISRNEGSGIRVRFQRGKRLSAA